ncbi:MAG TPA: Gfo/Idh/MocA family oxidoreductase [Stellaceae bacterium]|nr:Gfo/Idh/MocA family oxidoreductase [Stellaceae bacterium]
MSKTHSVGIIGLGMAVTPHAKSLRDLQQQGRLRVACAWSPSAQRRDRFAQNFGLPTVDRLDRLIDDPAIDTVLLLTPPNARLELIERLAKARKHVIMEKPIERTTAAAERIVALCDQARIRLGIVLQHRFRPAAVKLRELLAAGALGDLALAQLTVPWWRPQAYYDEPGRGTLARDGGGVLISQAIHSLDLMLSLAGPVIEVAAIAGTSRLHRMETEDFVSAGLRFANGALGGVIATTGFYPGTPEQLILAGAKGTAMLAGDGLRVQYQDGRSESVEGEGKTGGGADPMAFPHDAHRALIAEFFDALDAGREPAVPGHQVLGVHHLIDALLLSARRGQAVAPGTEEMP